MFKVHWHVKIYIFFKILALLVHLFFTTFHGLYFNYQYKLQYKFFPSSHMFIVTFLWATFMFCIYTCLSDLGVIPSCIPCSSGSCHVVLNPHIVTFWQSSRCVLDLSSWWCGQVATVKGTVSGCQPAPWSTMIFFDISTIYQSAELILIPIGTFSLSLTQTIKAWTQIQARDCLGHQYMKQYILLLWVLVLHASATGNGSRSNLGEYLEWWSLIPRLNFIWKFGDI